MHREWTDIDTLGYTKRNNFFVIVARIGFVYNGVVETFVSFNQWLPAPAAHLSSLKLRNDQKNATSWPAAYFVRLVVWRSAEKRSQTQNAIQLRIFKITDSTNSKKLR